MLRAVQTGLTGLYLAASLAAAQPAVAQSDLDLSLEEYMAKAGADAKLLPRGAISIDGHRMLCGRRATVLDPNFDSWGGAYPGFVILNMKRLEGLPTQVKLFVFAHECGHQFVGRDEEDADCFAVKRGRRYGWLTESGMDEVCSFISRLKGSWDHSPGPKRCALMRQCYRDAAPKQRRTDRQ